VTGHTDPLPVRPGGRFTDNDELALARALTGADVLAAGGLPADAVALRTSAGAPRERTLTLAIVPRRRVASASAFVLSDRVLSWPSIRHFTR
jgi:hypothetical protein